MSQHDNGRRAVGHPGEAWQHGNENNQGSFQQDQAPGTRYGSPQGNPRDHGGARGQHEQFDQGGRQWGDNQGGGRQSGGHGGQWRDHDQGARGNQGGQGGQGSFGGQASSADNDYGNRGITESGNFGNYGPQRGQGRGDDRGRYAGTYGQSAADQGGGLRDPQGAQQYRGDHDWQNPGWQGGGGAGSQSVHHDPHYRQWREEQMQRLDDEYAQWRQHHYQRFADDFEQWRANRGGQANQSGSAQDTQASAKSSDNAAAGQAK